MGTTPVVTATSPVVNAAPGEIFTASQLFSASDTGGDPILDYQVEDETTGPDAGFWVLDGAVLPNGQITEVSAAQLSELSFVAASRAEVDTLQVAASDMAGFGAVTSFNIVSPSVLAGPAPVVIAANALEAPNLDIAASSLFGGSAFGGQSVTAYEVEDTTADSSHWVFNGTVEPAGQLLFVEAAQLSELTFQTGYSTDTVMVRADDGTQWGNYTTFTVQPPPNQTLPADTMAQLVMVRDSDGAYEFYDIGHNTILLDGPLGQIDPAWQAVGIGGFSGNDTADLMMRNPVTGALEIDDVTNNAITGSVALGQVGLEWQVAGFGDFSGRAGETDILMRDSNNGAFEVYDIGNNTITWAAPMGEVGLEWQVAGFGDFSSRAGETDMLMRNSTTGAFEVYDIRNNAITSSAAMGQVGLEWTIAGFGDFSGNANETDMLMRNSKTGVFELYDISNNAITATFPMGQVGLEWSIVGVTSGVSSGAPGTEISNPAIEPASSLAQLTQAMATFATDGGAPAASSPLGQPQPLASANPLAAPANPVPHA